MKIVLVNKRYLPWKGGIEAHVALLARGLAEHPDVHVVQVLAVSPDSSQKSYEDGRMRVTLVPQLGKLGGMPLGRLSPDRVRKLGADIVHVHMPFPQGEWILARLQGPRRVGTYHSDVVRQWWALPLYRPFVRWVLSSLDGVITTSPVLATSSNILRRVEQKVVIPLGIDLERFQITRTIEREIARIRAAHGDGFVLFVGRLVGYKGLDVLIEAMRSVDAVLLIVGEGPLRDRLLEQARRLEVAERVRFVGSVPDDQLPAWYYACAFLVLPSVGMNEAYGLVQLEAHACGKPVISTALPTGVPFVNADGITGIIVRPGDVQALAGALRRMLRDETLRHKLGEQAQKRVREEFRKEVMIERHVRFYKTVLNHH